MNIDCFRVTDMHRLTLGLRGSTKLIGLSLRHVEMEKPQQLNSEFLCKGWGWGGRGFSQTIQIEAPSYHPFLFGAVLFS